MTTFPVQDLTALNGRGVYCPSQWGMPYVPLRYFCGHRDGATYIATYDHLLTSAGSHPARRLSNFAGICQTIMAADTTDNLQQAIGCELINRLLDMPSMAGLHHHPTYIHELHDYLKRHVEAIATVTGVQTPIAVSAFIDALHTELLRRSGSESAAVQVAT
jgi:hypothetical protein